MDPFSRLQLRRQAGCQIDYMVQTRFNTLYICEVKFTKNPIGPRVIEEMEEKTKRLKVPKRFSIRPVLIHVNGVEDSVLDQGTLIRLSTLVSYWNNFVESLAVDWCAMFKHIRDHIIFYILNTQYRY